MAIPATQMRPGMIIKHNDSLHLVFKVEHRTPGNLRAFIQAKLRNLKSGAMFEHRFRSADAIEKVIVDEVPMEFLYADGDQLVFMDQDTYDQIHLDRDLIGDAAAFLDDGMEVTLEMYDERPISVQLPEQVEAVIVEADAVVKGQTASSSYKPAVLENGVRVMVPPHIESGTRIVVDVYAREYVRKAD